MNETALEMLREKELRRGTDVFTSDSQSLGKALAFHYRPDEIDRDLKLYATYLEVSSLLYGSSFYVPVEFVAGYDSGASRVELSVPFSAVMNETWDREPSFVAGRQDTEERLPLIPGAKP
ncbi:MAG: hypothetical protein ACK2UK_22130 [Candidatus Promineifilaceae bacterium]|jgi:hypothetical protein